jgi:hypothetical protein
VKRWPVRRPHRRWVGAALVPFAFGGHYTTAALTAAAGISLLVLVLVIAAVALGAAFGRSAAQRRACLQALEVLLRLSPWSGKR